MEQGAGIKIDGRVPKLTDGGQNDLVCWVKFKL
jgi:hypothetical protein